MLQSGGDVSVLAVDQFGILSIGGSLGLSGKAQKDQKKEGEESQTSTAIGGVVSVNVISGKSYAYVDRIDVGAPGSYVGDVAVQSFSRQHILAIAGAAAAATQGNAVAVTMGVNVLAAAAQASLTNSKIYGKTLAVHSANEASILSIAGGVTLSTGNNKAAAIAVNVIAGASMPAIGADTSAPAIEDTADFESTFDGLLDRGDGDLGNLDVTAEVINSEIHLNGSAEETMKVWAETSSAILAIAAGISVSIGQMSDDNKPTEKSTNLAGSGTVNVISRNVTARVTDSVINSAGAVSLVARDFMYDGTKKKGSRILAIAGQVGVSTKGSQAGAAIGVNVINSNVEALYENNVTDASKGHKLSGLKVDAESVGQILSVTASVSVAVNSGEKASAKSAALGVNVINKNVKAIVSNDTRPGAAVTNTGPLSVRAVDTSEILGVAASVAVAVGADASSLGGALAVNVISTKQLARVYNANMDSTGDIKVQAEGNNAIIAANLSVAGSGLAVNPNVIVTGTNAEVENSLLSGANVSINATQQPSSNNALAWIKKVKDGDADNDSGAEVDSDMEALGIKDSLSTNILALSLNVAVNIGGSKTTIGAAVAVNVIVSDVKALVTNSTINASGAAFNVTALNNAGIWALTMGTAVSAGSGAGVSVMLASNTIVNQTHAIIKNSSLSNPWINANPGPEDPTAGNLNVLADSRADILALTINAAVSTGGAAVGVFLGVNVIDTETFAKINGNNVNTVSAAGTLHVKAVDTSSILAASIAVSASGGGAAVGVANIASVIVGEVCAEISGLASLSAGQDLKVETISNARIVSIAVGVSASSSSAAVAATLTENIIVRKAEAWLKNVTTATVGGDLVVLAQDTGPTKGFDWRATSWGSRAGVEDISNDEMADFNSKDDDTVNIGKSSDPDKTSFDPNKQLFNPASGIFSLVVSVAASGSGAAVAGALTFNWLERSTQAGVEDVDVIRLTSKGKSAGKSSVKVEAVSSAAAFGGVLAVGASGGGAAVGASAAINVLDNKILARIVNSDIRGWNSDTSQIDAAKLGDVTVNGENTSGAVALAVAVGASGGSAGVGATITLNIGMGAGKEVGQLSSAGSAKDRKAANDQNSLAGSFYNGLEEDGVSAYTSDDTDYEAPGKTMGGESAEASIHNSDITSSGGLVVEALQNSALVSVNLSVGASSSVGVSASIALNLLSANAAAYATGSNITAGAGKFDAQLGGRAWSFLVGVGAGGTAGATALLSVSRVSGNALAYFEKGAAAQNVKFTATSKDIENNSLVVNAYSDIQLLTLGLSVGAGGTAGVAGGIALALAGANVRAVIKDADLDLAGNLVIKGVNESQAITTALSVGAGGSAGVAAAVAVNLGKWSDAASYDPHANKDSKGKDSSEQLEGMDPGANAGDGFSTISSFSGSVTKAGDISVTADNKSQFVSALLLVGAGGAAGVAAGMVLNLLNSTSSASFHASGNVNAAKINVNASNSSKMWATMAAVGAGGAGAGAGSLALNLSDTATTAALTGAKNVTLKAESVTVNAVSQTDLYALALAVAASGTASFNVSFALNAVTNPTQAFIQGLGTLSGADKAFKIDTTASGSGDVSVSTLNSSTLVAGTFGLAASGTVAAGLSVSINIAQRGQLATVAQNSRKVEDKKQTLGGLDENGNYACKYENGKVYFLDDKGRVIKPKAGKDANEYHYLVYTDPDGEQYTYRFKKSAVGSDGGITLDMTDDFNKGNPDISSLGIGKKDSNGDYEDSLTYRSSEFGTPSFVDESGLSEIFSSQAYIGEVVIDAGGAVTVKADSKRLAITVAAGLAASGGGSGYGSVGVSVGKNTTEALIRNSEVTSNGNLTVDATNTVNSFTVTGSIAAGVVGAGAAVSVTVDGGDTRAQVLGGSVTANTGNINVTANTKMDMLNIAIAVAGGAAAVGGSVAVGVMQGSTLANIDSAKATATQGSVTTLASFAKPDTSLTLNNTAAKGRSGEMDSFLNKANTEVTGAKTEANKNKKSDKGEDDYAVNESFADAFSSTGIMSVTLAVAGGGVGASGGLAVNVLQGSVESSITGDTAKSTVNAGGVNVGSVMNTTISSYVATLAVGGVGLTGALNINILSGNTRSAIENSTVTADINVEVTANQTLTITGLSFAGAVGGVSAGFGLVVSSVKGVAEAAILGNSNITTGNVAKVDVNNTLKLYSYAIGVSVGFLGAFGGGVVVNLLKGRSSALVKDSEILSPAVMVDADESITSKTLGVQASLGGIAIALGVAVTKATGEVSALVSGSTITSGNLFVDAKAVANLRILGIGVAVGGVSAGIIVSEAHLDNRVTAGITGDSTLKGGSVTVDADADWNVYTWSLAGSAGLLFAGSGSSANSTINTRVRAYADGVTLDGVNSLIITASGTPKVEAHAWAPAVSMLAGLGISVAQARIAASIESYAKGLILTEGSAPALGIHANLKRPYNKVTDEYEASAKTKAWALGLGGAFGAGGAEAISSNNAKVYAHLDGLGGTKPTLASLDISAQNESRLEADASGIGLSLGAGVGYAESRINSNAVTYAFVSDGFDFGVTGALNISSKTNISVGEKSKAGAGAIGLALAAGMAKQTIIADTHSALGENLLSPSDVALGGTYTAGSALIKAENIINSRVDVDSVSGSLINGSGTDGIVTINVTAEAEAGRGIKLTAGDISLFSENNITKASYIEGTTVGLLSVNAGDAKTNLTANSLVTVSAGAELLHTGATERGDSGYSSADKRGLTLEAFNRLNLHDVLSFFTAAAIASPWVSNNVTANLNAIITVAENAKLRTSNPLGGDILMHAGSNEQASLKVGADLYSFASAGSVGSSLTVNTNNTVRVLEGAAISSSRDLILAAGYLNSKYNVADPDMTGWSEAEQTKYLAAKALNGIGNSYLRVNGDIYDKTVVPLSFANGGLFINNSNLISTASGSTLQSRGDAEISAQRGGGSQVSELYAHNWVNALEGPALTDYSKRVRNISNHVQMDGALTAGVGNDVDALIQDLNWDNWDAAIKGGKLNSFELERLEGLFADFEKLCRDAFGDTVVKALLDAYPSSYLHNGATVLYFIYTQEYSVFATKIADALIGDLALTITSQDLADLKKAAGSDVSYNAALTMLETFDLALTKLAAVSGRTVGNGALGDSVGEIVQAAINAMDIKALSASELRDLSKYPDMLSAIKTARTKLLSKMNEAQRTLVAPLMTALGYGDVYSDWDGFDWQSFWYNYDTALEAAQPSDEALAYIKLALNYYDSHADTRGDLTPVQLLLAQQLNISSAENINEAFDNSWLGKQFYNSLNTTGKDALTALRNYGFDWDKLETAEENTLTNAFNSFKLLLGITTDVTNLGKTFFAGNTGQALTAFVNGGSNAEWKAALSKLTGNNHDWSKLDATEKGYLNTALQSFMNTRGNITAYNSYFDAANYTKIAPMILENLAAAQSTGDAAKMRVLLQNYNQSASLNAIGKGYAQSIVELFIGLKFETLSTKLNTSTNQQMVSGLSYLVTGENSHFINVKASAVSFEHNLVTEYKELSQIVTNYGASSAPAKEVKGRLDILKTMLESRGLGETVNGAFVLTGNTERPALLLHDVNVFKGNVRIYAESMDGTGTIEAIGRATLNIASEYNSSTLCVQDMTISSKPGGQVLFMGGLTSAGGVTITRGTDHTSDMIIRNNVEFSTLVVAGLRNLLGKITIRSAGDLMVQGGIYAQTQDLLAVGTLRVAIPDDDGFYNVGGIPVDVTSTDNDGNKVPEFHMGGNDGLEDSGLFALGDIYISAAFININGIIQSGVNKMEATLDNSSTTQLLSVDKTGKAKLGYTVNGDTVTFDPIKSNGGNVYLRGVILNTNKGFGNIRLYNNPDIVIVNEGNKNIVLDAVDTGSTTPGVVYVWDNNIDNGPGEEKGNWVTAASAGRLSGSTLKADSGYYYHYISGADVGKVETYMYCTKTFMGVDAFAKDESSYKLYKSDPSAVYPIGDTGGFISGTTAAAAIGKVSNVSPGVTAIAGINGITGQYFEYSYNTPEGQPEYWTRYEESGFWFLKEKRYYNYKRVKYTTTYVNWMVIDTDKDINVTAQQGGGTLTIKSTSTGTGSVTFSDYIKADGNIKIDAKGDIKDSDESWIQSVKGDISINTTGNVGSQREVQDRLETSRIKIMSRSGMTVNVAGAQVYLESVGTAALKLSGTATVKADILSSAGLIGSLSAPQIILEAAGSIGAKGAAFTVTSAAAATDVVLTASVSGALGSDIFIKADRNLQLTQLTAPGTINLETTESIKDYNLTEMEDEIDVNRMQELWDALDILQASGETAQQAQLDTRMVDEYQRVNGLYHQYWAAVNEPDYDYFYNSLIEHGFSVEEAESRATAIMAERALTQAERDAAREECRIALLNISETLTLDSSAYEGGLTLTEANVVSLGLMSQAEVDALRASIKASYWTEDQLKSKASANMFNGTTTTFVYEVSNLVAKNVWLYAGKDIGSYHYDKATIANYQSRKDDLKSFTPKERLLLWASESTDRVENPDGSLTVHLNDDINITMAEGGSVTIYAGGHALVGTGLVDLNTPDEQNLNVSAAVAGSGELRVKADGNLSLAADGSELEIGGVTKTYHGLYALGGDTAYLVAESSKGDIGAASNYMLVGQHKLAAFRAHGAVYIKGLEDLKIDLVNSDKSINIEGEKDIIFNGTHISIGMQPVVPVLDENGVEVPKDYTIITAKGRLSITGATIDIGELARLSGESVDLNLSGLVSGMSWFSLHDEGRVTASGVSGGKLVLNGSSQDDSLNFGDSKLDTEWTLTETSGVSQGRAQRDNLDLYFNKLENIFGGHGDNTVNMSGGAYTTISFKEGEDEINISGGQVDNLLLDEKKLVDPTKPELGPESGANLVTVSGSGLVTYLSLGEGDDELYVKGDGEVSSAYLREGDNHLELSENGSIGTATLGDGENTIILAGGSSTSITSGDGDNSLEISGGLHGTVSLGDGTNTADILGGVTTTLNSGAGDDTLNMTSGIIDNLNLGDGYNLVDASSTDVGGTWTFTDSHGGLALNDAGSHIARMEGVDEIIGTGGTDTLAYQGPTRSQWNVDKAWGGTVNALIFGSIQNTMDESPAGADYHLYAEIGQINLTTKGVNNTFTLHPTGKYHSVNGGKITWFNNLRDSFPTPPSQPVVPGGGQGGSSSLTDQRDPLGAADDFRNPFNAYRSVVEGMAYSGGAALPGSASGLQGYLAYYQDSSNSGSEEERQRLKDLAEELLKSLQDEDSSSSSTETQDEKQKTDTGSTGTTTTPQDTSNSEESQGKLEDKEADESSSSSASITDEKEEDAEI
ncbi:hypothetical protein LJC36_02755 [Desulfovibrio sp. OttesenSCG-928-C14]|nr:hypothetical protein [Desulfovibrio sp. OttesenSCG-928-C14]